MPCRERWIVRLSIKPDSQVYLTSSWSGYRQRRRRPAPSAQIPMRLQQLRRRMEQPSLRRFKNNSGSDWKAQEDRWKLLLSTAHKSPRRIDDVGLDRKSTRLNSSHLGI